VLEGHVVETLFSALCLGRRKLFIMMGFGSYCDEFGHPKDPNKHFTGIAGLLAWSDEWVELTQRWREIQKTEQVPNPFHMTDFVHHTEDFSCRRWESADERKRILGLFLDAIKQANIIPVSAAVSNRDFNSLTEKQRKKMESPYHVAFQEVTFNLAFAAANRALKTAKQAEDFLGNRIAMVYAKLKKFTGPAEKLWNAVKEHNAGAGMWMNSYTPGEPADYPPLQAADIWAYSLGHCQEKQKKAKPEARMAFNIFLSATFLTQNLGHKHFTFFDRAELLRRLGELPEVE
jgi:hypothetical protein